MSAATKLSAERELLAARSHGPMDESAVRSLIEGVGPIDGVLAGAEPEDKARLYAELGLELTFYAGEQLVRVEAQPVCDVWCRRGDLNHEHTAVLRGELVLG